MGLVLVDVEKLYMGRLSEFFGGEICKKNQRIRQIIKKEGKERVIYWKVLI